MTQLFNRKVLLPVFLCISVSLLAQPDSPPHVNQGVLDLRTWNFARQKIALAGHWNFYENELLTAPSEPSGKLAYFPEILTKTSREGVQFGTYSATLLLPPNAGKLAFDIPQLYSSYKLFVNGKPVAENGKPGTSKETTTPQWMPQVRAFEFTGDTLHVVLQIANFYHYNTGSKQPVYLGLAPVLEAQRTVAVNSNMAECVSLFVLGLTFFIIYYVRQEKKKITLYFSLLCVSWAIRSVFSNLYLFIDFFPDFDWTWMVRIEYITLYSMQIWTVLFFSRLFPRESSKLIQYIFVIVNCTFIAETLVMSPVFFTRWIALYLIVAALVLVHSAIITVRALMNERAGVWYLVVCLALSLILFSYDMLVFEGFFQHYNAVLFSVGYLVIFLLMSIALFYHLRIFKGDGSSGTLTFDDLYGNDSGK
jgi:hypothetical protein